MKCTNSDMTQTIAIREGTANVFVAVEHSNSELVGIHASRSANRFEALEPVRQGVDIGASRRARRECRDYECGLASLCRCCRGGSGTGRH